MNCSDIAEALDNRNVEELGTSERQDIEAHLAACPACERDWELHKAFSALTDMREPASFPADCRALVAAGASTSRNQRVRSRLLLIGVFAAVAAAAAMLTAFLRQQDRIPLATTQETVAPIPVSRDALAQIAVPAEQKTTVTESAHADAAIPADEPAKFTVLVLPVNYKGTDAASRALVAPVNSEGTDVVSRAAINALRAAVINELQLLPGLKLIDADIAGVAQDPPADYEVRINGGAGTRGKDFSASLFASELTPGGKTQKSAGTITYGSAACPVSVSSKPIFCNDPSAIAARAVKQFRATLFPFDLPAQRLLQADLRDATLGFDARVAALSTLVRRSDIAGMKGTFLDPAVVRAVIDLATSHGDEARRAHVWYTMRGVRDPALMQPLIAAASQSADREVQQEAVAALATFVEDTRASDALQTIARTDARPLVRALAQRGLSGESYWNEYVATSLKDVSRTDSERVEAFLYHALQRGPSFDSTSSATPQALRDVLDDDAIQALTVLLPRVNAVKGPDQRRTGLALINVASVIDHPAINKMVLDNLTTGTNKPLWTSVARAVVSFRGGDPALKAALAKYDDDANSDIRTAAESAQQR
jgi:hypothetical protein